MNKKWPDLVSHLFFLGFAIMALALYKTRFFMDGGADLISVINRENFDFVHARYILVFSQWLPLFMVKLRMPLDWIMMASSLNFVIFSYVLFLVSRYIIKDRSSGVFYLLAATVSVGYIYYLFPISEIMYGMGMIILLASLIYNEKYRSLKGRLFGIVLLFFIIFSHPMVWIVLLVWLTMLLFNSELRQPALLIFGISLLIMFVLLFSMQAGNPFSANTIYGRLTTGMDPATIIVQFGLFLWKYLVFTIMATFTLGLYFRSKRFMEAIAILGAIVITYFVARGAPGTHALTMSGITIMALSLFYATNRDIAGSRLSMIIIFLFVAGGTVKILSISGQFTRSVKQITRLIEHSKKMESDKFILDNHNVVTGGYPYYSNTSLLLSSIDGDSSVFIFTTDNARQTFTDRDAFAAMEERQVVSEINRGFWNMYTIGDKGRGNLSEKMNPAYFTFSQKGFKLLSESGHNSDSLVRNSVKIVPGKSDRIRASNDIRIELTIQNLSDSIIFSNSDNGLQLVLYGEDTRMYSQARIPLEADIEDEFHQVLYQDGSHFKKDDHFSVHLYKNDELVLTSEKLSLR